MNYKQSLLPMLVSVGWLALPIAAEAQHMDFLLQDVNRRLASGSADFLTGQWTMGRRVFAGEFDGDYAVSNPGFNSLALGSPSMPAGAAALPGNTALGYEFLPMKIDGTVANLFYWPGTTPGAVQFGALPAPGYKLSLFGKYNAAGVDGAPELVPGDVIDETSSTGVIHRHRFFFLDDGDGNAATAPVDGIYLLSFRATMAGLDSSKPIYTVWGTPGSTLSALQAAESWVDDRIDDLAPDFNADFNGDLAVDGTDFLLWQRHIATAAPLQKRGDADRNGAVDGGDLTVWTAEFGATLASFVGAASVAASVAVVPEPAAGSLAAAAFLAMLSACNRRPTWKRVRPGSQRVERAAPGH